MQATFFDDRLLKDVAEELGVTESRVSQLRTEALGHAARRDAHDPRRGPAPGLGRPRHGAAARRRASYYADIARRATLAQRGTLAERSAAVQHAV